ncbi:MAG: hypothetical protein Q7K03_08360 [Dehalococcoidia bacterium]|nr:hypothetical protein [Dehalococcoidia bacterium]
MTNWNDAALPAGDNNIGDVDIVSIAAGANTIGDVRIRGTASLLYSATGGDIGSIGAQTLLRTASAQNLKNSAGAYESVYSPVADAQAATGLAGVQVMGYNAATLDRLRTIASSGAGLGVQQVGTLGELITLAASAARTATANGTPVTGLGWRSRYIILFDLTVADTDAGDTLDVYVDVSLDGSTWLNAVHFTQIIGTDAASKRYAVLDPSAPGTAEILVTADAAAGVVRPSLFGPQMRARWAIVDAGTDDASFTFSVVTYAI